MISEVDAQIGRVFDALEQSGEGAHTYVIFAGDNGLAVGQHGLMGKQNLYDHSTRVPLLISGPGLPAGRRVDALTCHADVLPTICALTGVAAPSAAGSDLTSLLDGGAVRDEVCAVFKDVQRTASDGRWKLIRYYRSSETGVGEDRVQLFNPADDPYETRDLSGDPAAATHLSRLATSLARWQREVGDPWADRPVLMGSR
jgi:arylsulfatase A-like enzyme